MIELRRVKRFSVKFKIRSNEVEGEGINISENGFGFLTEEEIIPADNVPFIIRIFVNKNINKEFEITGKARLLFSTLTKNHTNLYYNGFEFIELDDNSKINLRELLNTIELT